MLNSQEVAKLYAKEMLDRNVDIGDPMVELEQNEWESLYALYLKGFEDGKYLFGDLGPLFLS